MSVIAKMRLSGVLFFGSGAVSQLSCVCENDLMAAYAKAGEDRLFTRYSPWGEMKVGHALGENTSHPQNRTFYVIALRGDERPACEGAVHVHRARCHVIHDFGSSKQVEMKHDPKPAGGAMTGAAGFPYGELDWRMTIDNPPAVAFFEPGKCDYWVAFYDADKFSIQTALADAHA